MCVGCCDCQQAGAEPKRIAGIASNPESRADGIEGVGLHPCDKEIAQSILRKAQNAQPHLLDKMIIDSYQYRAEDSFISPHR